MRILVTGDEGKLGSLVKQQLLQRGHTVNGFDINRNRSEDVRNQSILPNFMRHAETVVHLAGLPHPNKGGMPHYFNVNVQGTMNVLQAAVEVGVKRVIYASSTAYYGCDIKGRLTPAYFPIDESHPPANTPGYAAGMLDAYNQSKVMTEQLLAYYGTNKLLETVALRLAPANSKVQQYPKRGGWRKYDDWRRGCFYANCDPDYAVLAFVLAVEAEGPFYYEAFNIADKWTYEEIDVKGFLASEYPDTKTRGRIYKNSCLFDISRAVEVLGFTPNEDKV